ncbi:actin-related protein 2/3 complex subunit 3 [Dipodascopsis tothii]|uniref:actin-related protein 2/3 complex subunit 3 n=1 Tax=Dipodascopsis tothii TaxID=44089 RepID=UPI0034CD3D96
MPAYHSTFLSDDNTRIVGNFAVVPLRTKLRGPAYTTDDYDMIDECLDLFRANSFFRNFEIKGPEDRTLIYGILFISDCLTQLSAKPNAAATSATEAGRLLSNVALDHFAIPGEPGFPLNSLYTGPRDKTEAELLRGYLTTFRQELAQRLVARIYADGDRPSKYWLAFTRRRFMNKSLS